MYAILNELRQKLDILRSTRDNYLRVKVHFSTATVAKRTERYENLSIHRGANSRLITSQIEKRRCDWLVLASASIRKLQMACSTASLEPGHTAANCRYRNCNNNDRIRYLMLRDENLILNDVHAITFGSWGLFVNRCNREKYGAAKTHPFRTVVKPRMQARFIQTHSRESFHVAHMYTIFWFYAWNQCLNSGLSNK